MSETNLTNLISAAVAAKLTPEFIEKEVDSRVEKLIVESVDRALRSYSDTGKLIEKAIEDALRVEKLDLPSYGSTVLGILKAQIEARVAPLVAGKLSEDMEALLHLAPQEIKLSVIADGMIKDGYHDSDYGEVITVILEEPTFGSSRWLYLDDEHHYEDRDKHKCSYSILIDKDGKVASATIRGRSISDHKHVGRDFGLGQKIRAWHACGTVIELDIDSVCITIGDY